GHSSSFFLTPFARGARYAGNGISACGGILSVRHDPDRQWKCSWHAARHRQSRRCKRSQRVRTLVRLSREQGRRHWHDRSCRRAKTILSIALPSTAAPALMPNLNFRLDSDFLPIVKLASAYHVLVVHPSVPARSLSELVALLKSQPDKLTFSSGGFGTPAHLAGELFKLQTGVSATHVPYQALPRAIGDLLNGTNHYQFITPLPVLDLIATRKLPAIAVTGPARLPALEDVPTVGEAGFPDLIIQDWVGFSARSGTPKETVVKLNAAINRALAKSSVRDAFGKVGAEPAGGTPAEFGTFVDAQVAHWTKVVKEAGIKLPQ